MIAGRRSSDFIGGSVLEVVSDAVAGALEPFRTTLANLRGRFDALAKAVAKHADLDAGKKQALADGFSEMREATARCDPDEKQLLSSLSAFGQKLTKTLPETNDAQRTARKAFGPSAEAIRGLVKQGGPPLHAGGASGGPGCSAGSRRPDLGGL